MFKFFFTLLGHFCPPGSESRSGFQIQIRIRIQIRNPAPVLGHWKLAMRKKDYLCSYQLDPIFYWEVSQQPCGPACRADTPTVRPDRHAVWGPDPGGQNWHTKIENSFEFSCFFPTEHFFEVIFAISPLDTVLDPNLHPGLHPDPHPAMVFFNF